MRTPLSLGERPATLPPVVWRQWRWVGRILDTATRGIVIVAARRLAAGVVSPAEKTGPRAGSRLPGW